MANLKEIRTRISSITSTRKITSAMKMVSASKLKRAQDNIEKLRPYSEKLSEILANIASGGSDSVYSKTREVKKVLLIAISSNRGLCGAFNSNIIKKVIELKETKYQGKQVDIIQIGKKAGEGLKYRGHISIEDFNDIYDDLTFDNSAKISEKYMQKFVQGDYDAVELVYNQFKNAATQFVISEQLLPVVVETSAEDNNSDYIYEPSKDEIVSNLIPKALKIQMFKAILDSNASEHGARMTAMHKATDNAGDLLNDLTLTYNQARQAAITNEILEIVGGAEALNG